MVLVTQWFRSPFITAGVPYRSASSQLPVNAPWKAVEDGPSAWALDNHVGDHDGGPSSRLQPSPDPAIVAVWYMNQWIKVYCSTFQKRKRERQRQRE